MKKQPLKYRMNVLGLAIILFLCIRTYMPRIMQGLGFSQFLTVWLIVSGVCLVVSCLAPTMLIEQMAEIHPKVFKKVNFLQTIALVFSSMLLIVGVSVVNQLIINLFSSLTGVSFNAQSFLPITSSVEFLAYFVYIAVVPAFVEEIFLRGYILNMFLPYGRKFAIVLTSITFMLMHQSVESFLPIFSAAVIMACIYLYTGSLWGCVALHFTNNAYSFLMIYSGQSMGGVSSMSFVVFLNMALIIGGIGSVIYLKKSKINIFSMLKKEQNESGNLKVIAKSPIAIMALIMCLIGIVEYTIHYSIK